LLVTNVDDVDALRPAAVVDREQMAAGEREQLRHAVRLQALRDEMAADDTSRARYLRGRLLGWLDRHPLPTGTR